ncbi:multiple sugar transport system permease protein [Gibbsiella quercinecans]|uniref:Sugar ABC transporter permease n=1 Tax=Gibbsiella quercinecans TaxID=929813 RepID=A0A250B584_9GAMM|nr:sugar ABC transporter permease [Gibbsiella quercinecans]ATA21092.1 sugar ABC transporter permease [Gibbsiella quercinecans]RLM08463.1 sugar ABC transporter permease [Gibbsiella quercinecans]RLM11738.1 sugar ABC transporter permease [Gibbsiella quercinecans]TCT86724.1 multiple sugar transport system permease protein [Gibbsiella quercinecans]
MFSENRKQCLVLLLPALAILGLLTAYPIVSVIYHAFGEVDRANNHYQFVGLANFRTLFDDFFFVDAIKNTLVFTVVASVAQVVLGLGIALLFHRRFPGRRLALPLFIYPMMISTMVCSAIWRAWFHYDYGLLNTVLTALGLPAQEWLFNPHLALYAIALVDTWQWTPMAFLIVLAGLQSIPKDISEAALVDGAKGWRAFVYITLPQIKNQVILAFLLRAIDTFKLFDKVYVMTGGGPGNATETLSMFVYKYGFRFFDLGMASSSALVMLAISLAMTLFYARKVMKGSTR